MKVTDFNCILSTRTTDDTRVPIEADATCTTPGGKYFSRFCFDAANHKTKQALIDQLEIQSLIRTPTIAAYCNSEKLVRISMKE